MTHKVIVVTGAGSDICRTVAETQVDSRALDLDILSQESIRAVFDQVLLEAGRLDIVVNNAGMLTLPNRSFPRRLSGQEQDQTNAS
jgi:NAD(P)-dependent dehydrogenase (short-subunit alcohol dehydrogenase family)